MDHWSGIELLGTDPCWVRLPCEKAEANVTVHTHIYTLLESGTELSNPANVALLDPGPPACQVIHGIPDTIARVVQPKTQVQTRSAPASGSRAICPSRWL